MVRWSSGCHSAVRRHDTILIRPPIKTVGVEFRHALRDHRVSHLNLVSVRRPVAGESITGHLGISSA